MPPRKRSHVSIPILPARSPHLTAPYGPGANTDGLSMASGALGWASNPAAQRIQGEKATKERHAAEMAYLARMEINLDTQLATTAEQYANDPAGFQKAIGKSRKEFLSQFSDDRIRNLAGANLDHKARKLGAGIETSHRDSVTRQTEDDLRAGREHFTRIATQAAYNGDMEAAQEATEKYDLAQTTLFNMGRLTLQERIDTRDAFTDAITANQIQGGFERALAQGHQEAEQFITTLAKNNSGAKEFRAKDGTGIKRHQKMVELLRRRLQAVKADHERELKRARQQAEKALVEQQQAVFAGVLPRLNALDSSHALTQGELNELLDRQELTPQLHAQLSKALNTAEPDTDNPQEVARLYHQRDEDSVTPHAMAVETLNVYAGGRITKTTLDKILTHTAKGADEALEIKEYRRLARQAAGIVGTEDAEKARAEIRVSDEYDQRVEAGEKPDQIFKAIINRLNSFNLISSAQADELDETSSGQEDSSLDEDNSDTPLLIDRDPDLLAEIITWLIFKKVDKTIKKLPDEFKKILDRLKKPKSKNQPKKDKEDQQSETKPEETGQKQIEQKQPGRQIIKKTTTGSMQESDTTRSPSPEENDRDPSLHKRLKDGFFYRLNSKGSPSFGRVTPEMTDDINKNRKEREKVDSGDIFLRKGGPEGKGGPDGKGEKNIGEFHIKSKHWKGIEKEGFKNAAEFVEYVGNNFNEIYQTQGGERRDKDGNIIENPTRLTLVKSNGGNKILVIDLERKAGHWTVVTGWVREKNKLPKTWIKLWSRKAKEAVVETARDLP